MKKTLSTVKVSLYQAGLLAVFVFIITKFYDIQKLDKLRKNEEIINFFNEVCLQSEDCFSTHVTYKWKEKIQLYVVRNNKIDDYSQKIMVVKKIISKINNLHINGLSIELTNDSTKANSYLFFCSAKQITKNPKFYFVNDNNFGAASFHINNTRNAVTDYIDQATIFINTDKPAIWYETVLLEEIVQSFGFPNDSHVYSSSVFYQYKYIAKLKTTEFSDMDKEIMRLLYHPRMEVGLNRLETAERIREILSQ